MAERPSTKHNIQHDELNTTRPTYSAISRIFVTGSIGMSSTGVDSGTGDVTLYMTGTSTEMQSIFVQDEGIPKGSSNTFNFVGIPVDVSVSGTVARIFVTGTTAVDIHDATEVIAGPLDGDEIGYYQSSPAGLRKSKWSSIKRQLIKANGWANASGTWTCVRTADAPIYRVTIDFNMIFEMGLGNRVKVTQQSQDKYFLVHGFGITGSTTYLELYGGTDYTLVSGTMTSPQYSRVKAPLDFPLDPAKWSVEVLDTDNEAQATPTASTWYNLGSIQISVPIGIWDVYYQAINEVTLTLASVTSIALRTTLSTANNSESSNTFTSSQGSTIPIVTGGILRLNQTLIKKNLVNLVKTTYFLNSFYGSTGGTSLNFRGDLAPTRIQITSVYL